MVWPTMSGMIVERRDHVFTTRFSPLWLSRSTLTRRWSSMNGPFFRLLGIPYLPPGPTAPPPADDHLIGGLGLGPRATLFLAPGRRRVAPTGALALTAAERVVDGVHGHAPGVGTAALPPVPTRLAQRDQLGLGVAHGPDGGPAVGGDPPHLGRREPQGGEVALLGHQLDAHPRAPGDLAPGAGLQLDVVDDRTDRDITHGKSVTRADLGALPRLEHVAHVHPGRGQDVALLTVDVVEQADPGVAVGVVLDAGDLGRDPVLLAPEVDHAVLLLVAATHVAGGEPAVDVAAARAGLGLGERLLRLVRRDLGEVGDGLEPAPRARWLALAQRHLASAPENVDTVFSGDRHEGTLRGGSLTERVRAPVPLALAPAVHGG